MERCNTSAHSKYVKLPPELMPDVSERLDCHQRTAASGRPQVRYDAADCKPGGTQMLQYCGQLMLEVWTNVENGDVPLRAVL